MPEWLPDKSLKYRHSFLLDLMETWGGKANLSFTLRVPLNEKIYKYGSLLQEPSIGNKLYASIRDEQAHLQAH